MKKLSTKTIIILISVILSLIAAGVIVAIILLMPSKYKVSFYKDEAKTELIYSFETTENSKVAYDYDKYGIPTKNSDTEYDYAFLGWTDGENEFAKDANLPNASKDASYYPYFEKSARTIYYTIKFYNEDGETLLKTVSVEKGKLPVYDGDTPTKASTEEYTYVFDGWTPEVSVATADATYKATFKATINKYFVTFINDDDTLIKKVEVNYGNRPVFDGKLPEKENYQFVGWSTSLKDFSKDEKLDIVTGNITYKARYIMSVDTNYDSAAITLKEPTIPDALVEFDLIIIPDEESKEITFKFGNLVLPIYVNGELQEHYVPLNGKYIAYISDDLKVYLTEPEDLYQLVLLTGDTKSEPINLVKNNDGLWLSSELELTTGTKLLFADYKRGLDLDVTASTDSTNRIKDDMIIKYDATFVISLNVEDLTVLVTSDTDPLIDSYVIGSFNEWQVKENYKMNFENNIYTYNILLFKNDEFAVKAEDKTYGFSKLQNNDLFAESNGKIKALYGGNYEVVFDLKQEKITVSLVDELIVTINDTDIKLELSKTESSSEAIYEANLTALKDSEIKFNFDVLLVEDKDAYLNNIKLVDSKYIINSSIENQTLFVLVEKNDNSLKYNVWLDGCYKEYNLTYDLNGGVLSEDKTNPSTYNIETPTFTLNNPSKDYYEFVGWTYGEITTPELEVFIEKGTTGDITFTAKYKPGEYNITYVLNNGTLPEDKTNPSTYNVETETFTLNNPSKDYYEFVGWTYDEITTPEIEVSIENGTHGDITFTANYKPVEYSITYVLNDGALPQGKTNPEVYNIETPTFTLNNPEKQGYVFKGWSGTDLTGDTNTEVVVSLGSFGNREYTANWTPGNAKYNVTYYLQDLKASTFTLDESKTEVKDGVTETTANADVTVVITGFTFDSENTNNVLSGTVLADNSLTLKLYYTRNKYTVSYTYDNAPEGASTLPSDEEHEFGDTVEVKEGASCDGYTFDGWTSSVVSVTDGKFVIPTQNVTFVGTFTPIDYTITFNTNGGSEVTSITQAYQSDIVAPTDPTKTGYEFAGWNPALPAKMPLNGITVNALWTPITYTVRFNKNDENATGTMDDQTFTYDQSQALSTNNFEYNDMKLRGWALSSTGEVEYTPGQIVLNLRSTKNAVIDLYAIWAKDITKQSIRTSFALAETSYPFNGEAKEPAVSNTSSLNQGTDYFVTYSHNVNAGTAKTTITGIGEYEGIFDIEFEITPINVTLTWSEGGDDGYIYNGQIQEVTASFTNVKNEKVNLRAFINNVSEYDKYDFRLAGNNYTMAVELTGLDATNYNLVALAENSPYTVENGIAIKTYTMKKAELTLNWGQTNFTFDGTVKTVEKPTEIVDGLFNEDQVEVESISNASKTDAGSYLIGVTLSGSDASNYSVSGHYLNIEKRLTSVTWSVDSWTSVYDGTNKVVSASYKDVTNNDIAFENITVRRNNEITPEMKDVATYILSFNPINNNYRFSESDNNKEYVITQKKLTATWADEQDGIVYKDYTGSDINLQVTLNGLVGSDNLNKNLQMVPIRDVGTYENIKLLVSGTGVNNYDLSDSSFTISVIVRPKAIELNWLNYTKEYDGTNLNPSVSPIDVIGEVIVNISVENNNSLVGLYNSTATLTGENASNYAITDATETKECSITPKTITITPNSIERLINNPIGTSFTYTNTALIGSDELDVSAIQYTVKNGDNIISSETIPTEPCVYTIHVANITANSNYNLVYATGTLTYISKSLNNAVVTFTSNSYTFNNTVQNPEIANVFVGEEELNSTDHYTISYPSTGDGAYKNVGEYIVRLTGKGDYFGAEKDVAFTINPASLSVTVEQTGTLTYNTTSQVAQVFPTSSSLGQDVTYTYSDEENGTYISTVPGFTNAGSHTVYFKANALNHNEQKGSFTINIGKANLDASVTQVNYTKYDSDGNGLFVFGEGIYVDSEAKIHETNIIVSGKSVSKDGTDLPVGSLPRNLTFIPDDKDNYNNCDYVSENILIEYSISYSNEDENALVMVEGNIYSLDSFILPDLQNPEQTLIIINDGFALNGYYVNGVLYQAGNEIKLTGNIVIIPNIIPVS